MRFFAQKHVCKILIKSIKALGGIAVTHTQTNLISFVSKRTSLALLPHPIKVVVLKQYIQEQQYILLESNIRNQHLTVLYLQKKTDLA